MSIEKYTNQFKQALETLNLKQKEAVEQVDGPVMVVAGPGTGKTQLLAARVGHILDKLADINPRNILCLTFTEAGAVAMRKRLLQFIGPEAYNVNIFTFHSFCNKVIRENIADFGGYRNLQSLSDLEMVEVLHEIIDEFPNHHPLKRFKGNIYYDRYNLNQLFRTMKQENWTVEQIKEAYTVYAENIEDNEDFQYKRNYTDRKTGIKYQKGDPNPKKIARELNRYQPMLAGIDEFAKYNKKLEERERFDYADMILWVIEAWKKNPDLLMDYQEQYQYILVDEYQDTNGAQNQIVDMLASYWGESANVFVVGDDDQSIFRFQGASMDNIVEFKEKYNPEVVILENNYRSSQEILDRSKQLIEHNTKRLVQLYPVYQKELKESKTKGLIKAKPVVVEYPNAQQEAKDIADQIIALNESGTPLKDIAVIYKKHKNADFLIQYLTKKSIPLALKKKVNVLEEPLINQLITILEYVQAENEQVDSGERMLFELLHYSWFNIKAYDLAKLSIYCSRRTEDKSDDLKWRAVIQSEEHLKKAGVVNPAQFIKVSDIIEQWMIDIHNLTLQIMFEKILTDAGVFATVMNSGKPSWSFQLINTFFELIKSESTKRPLITLDEFLSVLVNMQEAELTLPLMKILHSEVGVQFLSAHSSKGLEFKHVFIIAGDDKNWVTADYKNRQYRFPPALVPATDKSDVDDDRRLFYVAMTRCEAYLQISYAYQNEDEKELEPCRFIAELMKESDIEIQKKSLEEDKMIEFTHTLLGFQNQTPTLIEYDLIDQLLDNYSMSVTHLNKYLRCPLSFYFENILKVPKARNKSMGFGNAIHRTLEHFFGKINEDPNRNIPGVDVMIDLYEKSLYKYRAHFTKRQYDDLKVYGSEILTGYYDEYHMRWSLPREFKLEKTIRSSYKGIPINGKIDSIHMYDDKIDVFDFKTGNAAYATNKLKAPQINQDPDEEKDLGGDYWRQIVFYKMLLSNDPEITKPMRSGTMDFIEPDRKTKEFTQKTIGVADEDVAIVEEQLKEAYAGIQIHKFDGCGEEDCHWCSFVKNQYEIDPDTTSYADEADEAVHYEEVKEEVMEMGVQLSMFS